MVTGTAQTPTDYLFAEQLRAERANAEDMRHPLGIPPFAEHGDRDNALNLLTEFSPLPDGIHHLSQKCFVGNVLIVATALKLRNFSFRGPLKRAFECLAGFQLLAINDKRV